MTTIIKVVAKIKNYEQFDITTIIPIVIKIKAAKIINVTEMKRSEPYW